MASLAEEIKSMIAFEKEQGAVLVKAYGDLKASHDKLAEKFEDLSAGIGDIPMLQETVASLRTELADARTAALMIADILPSADEVKQY